ncbi:MAG TPA: glycosyltransferase family 2 protein [Candidatus Andersenbacteria bacterium]|nr:glycosyltransferase family 2 protein [Candidatus Andersenbacteria bacterium]
MESVSIVIVNWNTGELLKKCIDSLLVLPEYSHIKHIVVVDNNSHDNSFHLTPSLSLVRRGESKITLLAQQKNLGFAKATNIGISYIHKHGGENDHILLLNPDTEVRAHAIERIVNVLEKNKKAGIVGCKLIHPIGTTQESVRTFPTFPILAMLFLKLHRIFPFLPLWKKYMASDFDYSKEQAVNQVMGAAFLIRNTVIQNIGLLDETFWVWFEEVDYCKRAVNTGWEIIYSPEGEVMHYGGVSFNQLRGPKKTMPFLMSALAYAKKHLGTIAYTCLLALYPLGFFISLLPLISIWGVVAIISAIVVSLVISVQMGLSVIAFAIVAWWVWEHAEEGLLFFIVISPLLPLLKVTQTLENATFLKDIIIATLFVKTFAAPLFAKTLPYRKNAFFAPIIALTGWAIVETVHASSHALAALRLRDILLYIILYFAVLYLPHSKKIMRTRFVWFIASLVVVMILGVMQLKFFPDSTVLRFDPVRQVWIPRMGSTFGHPTVFAEFLVTAAMLCIGYLLAGYKNVKNRLAIAFLFIATLPLLYYTYTRASWIAFVAGMGMIGLTLLWKNTGGIKLQKKHVSTSIIILLIIIFGIFRFTHVGTFLRSAFDPTYASNADRLGFVTQLIAQTSNADAIIGKGLGSSITQTDISQDITAFDIASGASRTIQLSQDATLVDNQYLKTFIEMGVVGVAFTLWLFWRFFSASMQIITKNKSRLSRMLGIIGVGFITTFIIQALFVDIWDVYPTNAIFWILAALISQSEI